MAKNLKFKPRTKEELQDLIESNIHLGEIDVSLITDMSNLFFDTSKTWSNKRFDGIEDWDVSNVTDMKCMFANCKNLNQDISRWNVDLKNTTKIR